MKFIKSLFAKLKELALMTFDRIVDITVGPIVTIYQAKTADNWDILGIVMRVVFFSQFVVATPAFVLTIATWYMGWVFSINNLLFWVCAFCIVVQDDKAVRNQFQYTARAFKGEAEATVAEVKDVVASATEAV